MVEKNENEEMQILFKQLNEENKDTLNLVAKAMEIAQKKGVNK